MVTDEVRATVNLHPVAAPLMSMNEPLSALLTLREALSENGFNTVLEAELGVGPAKRFAAMLAEDSADPPDAEEVRRVLLKIGIWGNFLTCVSAIAEVNRRLGESVVESLVAQVIPLEEARDLERQLVDTDELVRNPQRHELLNRFCYMVMGVEHQLAREPHRPFGVRAGGGTATGALAVLPVCRTW